MGISAGNSAKNTEKNLADTPAKIFEENMEM